eukprot:jgi/Tetstr1/454135/TSEL_041054.t1
MSSERYWTARAATIHAQLERAIAAMDGDAVRQYMWSTGAEALASRDAELVCAMLRLADARSEHATELRFGLAIRAMEKKHYDCAYAAWDDGGRCWIVDDMPSNVPDSRTAAAAMMAACGALIAMDARTEEDLCARMSACG